MNDPVQGFLVGLVAGGVFTAAVKLKLLSRFVSRWTDDEDGEGDWEDWEEEVVEEVGDDPA